MIRPEPINTQRNPATAANRAPLDAPRHDTPDEVAALVAYLRSPDTGFVTATTSTTAGAREGEGDGEGGGSYRPVPSSTPNVF